MFARAYTTLLWFAIGSFTTDWRPQLLTEASPFVRAARAGQLTLLALDARHVGLNYSSSSPRHWPLNYYESDAVDFAAALEVFAPPASAAADVMGLI